MNEYQVALLWDNLAGISPDVENVGSMFIQRLLRLKPWLKDQFPANGDVLGKRFFQNLGMVVWSLERPETMPETLRKLGFQDSLFGVPGIDCNKIGEALFWTLEKHLGSKYTEECHGAWKALFSFILGFTNRQMRPLFTSDAASVSGNPGCFIPA